MKHYSFLTESKKKLLKRLSRYTPEQIARIREKMLALGKENGGWYSAEEYARRMGLGQLKRARKIDPQIKFEPIKDIFEAETEAGSHILRIPSKKSQILSIPFSREHFKNKKEYKKAVRDYYRSVKKWNENPYPAHALTRADTVSHEVDELALAYKYARKYGVNPTDIIDIQKRIYRTNNFAGNHNPEVLRREAYRHHLLNTLYGRGSYISPPRSHTEYRLNRPLSREDMLGALDDWAYEFQHIH